MSLRYEILTGADVAAALDDLARLRIEVFREWPYLYDGDMAYERGYMRSYENNPNAILVGAFDQGKLVGASTGTALNGHDAAFATAFAPSDFDLNDIFYCAESVLLPAYRGQGAGHAFFDHREDFARARHYRYSAFCAVTRPDDHPKRAPQYRPLDPFWRARGYEPLEGVIATLDWRDIGEAESTTKPLQFWIKPL